MVATSIIISPTVLTTVYITVEMKMWYRVICVAVVVVKSSAVILWFVLAGYTANSGKKNSYC